MGHLCRAIDCLENDISREQHEGCLCKVFDASIIERPISFSISYFGLNNNTAKKIRYVS